MNRLDHISKEVLHELASKLERLPVQSSVNTAATVYRKGIPPELCGRGAVMRHTAKILKFEKPSVKPQKRFHQQRR